MIYESAVEMPCNGLPTWQALCSFNRIFRTMKRIVVLLLLINTLASAQVLRDINYRYLYDAAERFNFQMKVVRSEGKWNVFYTLQLKDTTSSVSNYLIQFDVRTALSEQLGKVVRGDSLRRDKPRGGRQSGVVLLPVTPTPQIIVARVSDNSARQAWIFYKVLESNFPTNGGLVTSGQQLTTNYSKGGTFTITGVGKIPLIVSYYNDKFPAATPTFSTTMGRVSPGIRADSIFMLTSPDSARFTQEGLYLIQADTTQAEGISFRIQNDYPKLAKIENLADPLIYVCNRQEHDRLKSVKGDKKAFDRIVMGIIGDTERAKKFMRSYFKRVELANQFFTSYKEGWKTDRGMIYIIFGLPDEVFRFSDREVWSYKNDEYTVTFDFTKSPSVFDPDNYVLVRDKKYEKTLYEVIDLWRSARF